MVWWVQLIIMIAAAVLSRALAPKPKNPEPAKVEIPTVEEGTGIYWLFGEGWIDDSQVLTYREMGRIAIKQKSKK